MPTARLIHESDITPALNSALIELLCLANPNERDIFTRDGRGWHGATPSFCTLVELNHTPIAYIGIVDRTIRIDPPRGSNIPPTFLRIAGPQNVSVHPHHRGQALSIQALNLAMQHALHQNFNAGLLFCTADLERLYFCTADLERLYSKSNWQTLPDINTPITRTENGTDLPLPQKNLAMFLPLKSKTFPPGAVHLQGNDW